jgi:phenylpropionate dioxygenase-like ring-hydroxylating dioxygenase large terminal subunit
MTASPDSVAEQKGTARSPGLTYQQLLDADTHDVPDILREESPRFLGDADVPIEHYISREWHELEKERLWSRVWQFACREEHIPRVGDHTVYEIAGRSYIVMRSAPDTIKAFPNACLHRGRQLKQYDGNCSEIRCPFHGFAWHLDGSLQDVPAHWDLPHVTEDRFHLPEVKVGTWDGFVFINPDPNAEPLEDYVKELAAHFDRWNLRDRYVQAHVSKVIEANWKIAQEAFCEAFHVNATHPQILPYIGDTNSQVDVWENCSRVITPAATPSPLLDWTPDNETILRYALDVRLDEELFLTVKEGQSARSAMADATRNKWRPIVGELIDQWSDAEMVDNLDYTLFPNLHPWGAFNRIVYRFRPNGDDHRSSIMEVLFLAPFKGERPPPAPVHHLGVHQPWTDAAELGVLGKVFEQDTFNMARVQLGLESTRKPGVTLANYQESKVRWLHVKLEQWLNGGD